MSDTAERSSTPELDTSVLQQQNGEGNYPRQSAQSASTNSYSSSRDGQSPRHTTTNRFSALAFRFFNSRDKENKKTDHLMTREGAIKQSAWDGLSKSNSRDKRLRVIKDLIETVKHNLLQISTLEGIYHDIVDLFDDDDAKPTVIQLVTEITITQHGQVGLGLRQTFFNKIRELGCDLSTLKWLSTLSQEGEKIDGFERDMDFMLAEWVKDHLFGDKYELSIELLELTISLIQKNSAYISASALTAIVKHVCSIGFKIPPDQTSDRQDTLTLMEKSLDLMETVWKFSDIPRDLVLYIIPVICIQVCFNAFREKAWHLAKLLLTSQMGHRTRKSLQKLLEDNGPIIWQIDSDTYNLMLRGAIFCLANAVWGHQKIETLNCSEATIISTFTKVITKSPEICIDVFTATKRLVQKKGADLQPVVWLRLLDLYNEALEHFKRVKEFDTKCSALLKGQLALIEQYHKENNFTASTEKLFEFIEKAVEFYPDRSAASLIEYKFNRIIPQTPNFIEEASTIVQFYASPKQHQERRKKAVQCMSAFFMKHRVFYEIDLTEKLVLPVVRNITQEKNAAVQYQLILALFDIARNVSFKGAVDLFGSSMQLVKKLMNLSITNPANARIDEATEESSSDRDTLSEYEGTNESSLTLDNLEVVVKNMEEVIAERWTQLSLKNLTVMINILIEHLDAQYRAGWDRDIGAAIRETIINTLLSFLCCPITNRIQRLGRNEHEPRPNILIKRKTDANENGFVWSEICRVTVDVLNTDCNWNVLKTCLERVGKILENMLFVRTADTKLVNSLCIALVTLNETQKPNKDELDENKRVIDFPEEGILSKYLPPVLAILLNYTSLYNDYSGSNRNNEICRVLVDCVNSDHLEALMAIDVAVQLVPDAMGSNAFKLLEILKNLEPSSKRAIPLIEFLSDSAEISEFHRFFNEDNYRTVVDILVPYADVAKFNAYIVSCIHRILMRWYVQIPQNQIKLRIAKYIEEKFNNIPLFSILSPESMKRQYSGDGRTVENPFLLGGDPATPPPESRIYCGVPKGVDKINEELLTAMKTFFRLGKIEENNGASAQLQQLAPDRYEETSAEHYFINDTIITLRRLVDKKWKCMEDNDEDVFSADGEVGSPSSPNEFGPSSFDQRKRYASAKNFPKSSSVKPATKALDDLYAPGGPHQQTFKTNAKKPIIAFVQLITRHMYGRSAYLMRALDEWPEDFEKSTSIPSSSYGFMAHILNVPGGLQPLTTMENDSKDIERALRVLDNIPGIEHHVVGVLYMAPGQETENEVLSNIYGTERYNKFVRLLGDVCSLKNCPGGLREGLHGSYTYSYTDALSHIVYQVATLMPLENSDSQESPQNIKKLLIGNNFVSIVFNESGKPFRTGLVSGQFDSVTLEIVPSDPKTVVVTVHAKSEIACWLAMKRVLLTDEAAARLIRKLVVRSYLSVRVFHSLSSRNQQSPYISTAVERLRKIYHIRDNYSA